MKNYGWWIPFLLTVKLVASGPPNIYLMQEGNSAHCIIANETESSPIMLINNKLLLEGSEYFRYPNDEYFCKLSTDRNCTEKVNHNNMWTYDISDNYDLPLITDRRWEDFSLLNTRAIKFISIHNISETETDFEFSLSVKIKDNAYIYICDGLFPPDFNCYWFIIDGWTGTKSVARKCEKGMIPKDDGVFPPKGSSCENPLITNDIKTGYISQLGLNKWTNLTFTNSNNSYSVKNIANDTDILKFQDATYSEAKHVLVATLQESPGEWKLHNKAKVYRTGGPVYIKGWSDKGIKRFSFSLLQTTTEEPIYIYLCEKEYITDSNYYRISLHHNNDPSVCVFKESFKDCTLASHAKNNLQYSSWTHFTLRVENGNFTLTNNRNETILQFNNTILEPNHLLIECNNTSSWKIQSYGFFTSNISGSTFINLHGNKKGAEVCVAVFARSCEKCNLTLELNNEQNKPLVTKTQSKKNEWEEIKLMMTLQEETKLKLNIKLNTIDNGRSFIGDIRNCSNNVRIISTIYKKDENNKKDMITCQSLKHLQSKANKINALAIPLYNIGIIDVLWVNADEQSTPNLKTNLTYKGCNGSENSIKNEYKGTILPGSLRREQLHIIPYTTYYIRLINKTNKSTFSKQFEFDATDFPSREEEVPKASCSQEDDNIIVTFKLLTFNDCTKIQGPLYYHIKAICSDKWCTESNSTTKRVNNDTVTITIPDIFGQSHYRVSLGISRADNTTEIKYSQICSMLTKPTAPRNVPNVTVFSITNTSISIRWKEPYPKTGTIEKYVIEYRNIRTEHKFTQEHITMPTKCVLWDEFICSSITKLDPQSPYSIKIRAKNEKVEKLSDVNGDIDIFTEEKAPTPPENLTLSWDNQLNLTITCIYPFQARGPTRKLHIFINDTEFPFDIRNESRKHFEEINATKFSASFLNIRAKFSNFAGFSNESAQMIYSPPKTPKIFNGSIERKDDQVQLNPNFIENLEGKSEIFIYRMNYSEKFRLKNTNSCEVFSDLNKKSLVANTTIQNDSKMINLMNYSSVLSESYFVIFLKNSYRGMDRCATYSEISLSDVTDSSILPWILVLIFLLCLCMGAISYRYKKEIISYKSAWLSVLSLRRREVTNAISESANAVPSFSPSVHVGMFKEYLNKALAKSDLLAQYDAIEDLGDKPHLVGLRPENIRKNRYKNIIPYDETRVTLNSIYSNIDDDYINANYIEGFNKKKAYIATQAPIALTLGDFWRMIWQEEVQCIVMLSRLIENGKKKCEQYWPESKETLECNGFTITCTYSKTNDDVTTRKLRLSLGSVERQITQIHYRGWLDKDVPTSTQGLNDVLRLMDDFRKDDKPIVVHCSAGVGRTGTLIQCDIAINMAKATQTVDMFSILYDLRQQRSKMVQIYEQYVFAHQVVLDAITSK